MGDKWIGLKIIWVRLTRNRCQIYHAHGHIVPHLVIGNIIVLLIEGLGVNGAALYYAHVDFQYVG